MQSDGRPDMELDALAAALGSRIVRSGSIPWGDSGPTHRLDLEDGRRVAARWVESPSRAVARQAARLMADAAAAAIPVPVPTLLDVVDGTWFVTPWVDGDVGARWLDQPDRARTLAHAMGVLHRSVRMIDPRTVGAGPGGEDSRSWSLGERIGDLPASAVAAVAHADATLAGRGPVTPTFVHGDFAPINVILGADGTVRALLDFEHARVGDPREDIAWWGWVVRHHHPDAWHAAWPVFCTAAGSDPVEDATVLQALVIRQLVRRAVGVTEPLDRQRWLGRLDQAARW
jgi:aminoglycoside phosphotransferase (APT) family kinase protein